MNNATTLDSGWSRDGRFNRMSFIGWNAFYSLLMMMVMLFITLLMPNTLNAIFEHAGSSIAQAILFMLNIVILIPMMIFSVRRLHDFNQSGWLALLELIPIFNIIMFIALMLIPGTASDNQYGEPRASKTWEVVLAFIFIGLFLLVWFSLLLAFKPFL